jgi:hypothetical protein
MSDFLTAVLDLVVGASAENDIEEVYASAREVMRASEEVEPHELNQALQRLADALATAPVYCLGVLGITAGALVERGGAPELALRPILDRLPEVLQGAADFADACRAAAAAEEGNAEEEQRDPVERFGAEVARQLPEAAIAWDALDALGLGAIALLSRSAEGRAWAREQPELDEAVQAVGDAHPRAGWLEMLLRVLDDEELLVLHPEQKRGYRVRIGGLADNFQLHTLLADALIGDPAEGWLAGARPDPRVAAAARDQPVDPAAPRAVGVFNLCNWTALLPDGTLPGALESSDHWIWNEGSPADILPFEGRRVVLLGPPPYARGWNAGRRFDGLAGSVEVLEQLSPAAVADWLDRLAAAARRAERS